MAEGEKNIIISTEVFEEGKQVVGTALKFCREDRDIIGLSAEKLEGILEALEWVESRGQSDGVIRRLLAIPFWSQIRLKNNAAYMELQRQMGGGME